MAKFFKVGADCFLVLIFGDMVKNVIGAAPGRLDHTTVPSFLFLVFYEVF